MQQLRRSASHLPSAIGVVASMECAITLTTGYTKLRSAFDQPIIEFQNAAFKLTERKAEAMIARVLVAGELDTVTASMAKWGVRRNRRRPRTNTCSFTEVTATCRSIRFRLCSWMCAHPENKWWSQRDHEAVDCTISLERIHRYGNEPSTSVPERPSNR